MTAMVAQRGWTVSAGGVVLLLDLLVLRTWFVPRHLYAIMRRLGGPGAAATSSRPTCSPGPWPARWCWSRSGSRRSIHPEGGVMRRRTSRWPTSGLLLGLLVLGTQSSTFGQIIGVLRVEYAIALFELASAASSRRCPSSSAWRAILLLSVADAGQLPAAARRRRARTSGSRGAPAVIKRSPRRLPAAAPAPAAGSAPGPALDPQPPARRRRRCGPGAGRRTSRLALAGRRGRGLRRRLLRGRRHVAPLPAGRQPGLRRHRHLPLDPGARHARAARRDRAAGRLRPGLHRGRQPRHPLQPPGRHVGPAGGDHAGGRAAHPVPRHPGAPARLLALLPLLRRWGWR